MRKITVFTNHFMPERFKINELAVEIQNKGIKLDVVTQIPNYPKGKFFDGYSYTKRRKEKIDGISVNRLFVIPRGRNPLMLLLNYLSYTISSNLFARKYKESTDAILVYMTSPIFVSWAGLRAAKKNNVKAYLYILDMWPGNLFAMFPIPTKWLRNRFTNMCIRIYRRFDKIFISSKSFEALLIEYGVSKDRIIYVPQHADVVNCERKTHRDENFKIVFTGNIGEAQGLDVLAFTAKKLDSRHVHNVKFTIVGDGRYREKFEALIARESVSSYFTFTGLVDASVIPEILESQDVAFVSLRDENTLNMTLPAKVQTYMASGIPVLASAKGETQYVLEEAMCGYVSKPEDPVDLADTILKLMSLSDEALEAMGKNGCAYATNNFMISRLTDIIIKEMKG